MPWTDFTLTVTTPLFNDHTDGSVRVSSLRGALRFWFRALIGQRVGNNSELLFKAEEHVFGSTERLSPIRMRIHDQPESGTGRWGESLNGSERAALCYLAGQGLTSGTTVARRYIDSGQSIGLKVAFSDDEHANALFLASLWLMCAYGGVGARTRRGFGGLHLKHRDGGLPEPWTAADLSPPGLDHYRSLKGLEPARLRDLCAPHLQALVPKPCSDDDRPEYPVLGEKYTLAGLSSRSFSGWAKAAARTGEVFKQFRSTGEYKGVILHTYRKPYPVGALGLPVNYYKGEVVQPEWSPSQGDSSSGAKETLRRASPLWLRFVCDPALEEWRVFSFAFHNKFLPTDRNHRVWLRNAADRNRQLDVTDTHVRERTGRWINSSLKSL
ncbi:CRISPR-associated protein Cmr1 [Nocardiopsis sp. Huas11]|uniref:type III-B CRISPR module RAMP protein Cmr1 n=1 Tax=Nocardiopsis sp. Huas11 TaxID=2183912 RepID=UPI000F11256A|nr:type III-B CRISPR module RAMP protein Cmr1 [Nocardiopsis sp. Huas11]RKS07014.1 CRISPR-associated protein Cmr1 [Nocardiopsis sp. Huas11]